MQLDRVEKAHLFTASTWGLIMGLTQPRCLGRGFAGILKFSSLFSLVSFSVRLKHSHQPYAIKVIQLGVVRGVDEDAPKLDCMSNSIISPRHLTGLLVCKVWVAFVTYPSMILRECYRVAL